MATRLMPDAPKLDHVPALDGLRGIACLLVLLAHLAETFEWPPPFWGRFGSHGVYLFFALSGFLITRNLLADRFSPNRVRTFYVKRAARILPISIVTLTAVAIFTANKDWWWTAAYLVNYRPFNTMLGAVHYWSLCVEEHYYLIWPLSIWFLPFASARRMAWLLVLASFILSMATVDIIGHLCWFNTLQQQIYATQRATSCSLFGLALGSAIAFDEDWWRQGRRLLWLTGALLAAWAVWALGYIAVYHFDAFDELSTPYVITSWRSQVFMGAVFCFALSGVDSPLLSLCLDRSIAWLGKISYGAYVFHLPVLILANRWVGHGPVGGCVGIVAGVGLAAVSYRWFEWPIMNAARRWLEKRASQVPALAPANEMAT